MSRRTAISENGRCRACGRVIPPEWQEAHEAGRDTRRLDCPRQDLRAVIRHERPSSLSLPSDW